MSVRGEGLRSILHGNPSRVNGYPSTDSGPILNMGTIGDRVRALRGDMSRAELSRQTGIPKTTLQTLEEQPQRSNKWLPVLAGHFGVTLEWLNTGRGPKYPPADVGTPSQLATLDPDILFEALVLIDHEQEESGKYLGRSYPRRLAELYGRIAADGGQLSRERTLEFEREVAERKQGRLHAAKATGRRAAGRE